MRTADEQKLSDKYTGPIRLFPIIRSSFGFRQEKINRLGEFTAQAQRNKGNATNLFLAFKHRFCKHSTTMPVHPNIASKKYETWSVSSQLILIVLMFIGGCAGSTGGSIKVIRIYLTVKYGLVQLKKLLHPNAVIPIRMSNRSIPPKPSPIF